MTVYPQESFESFWEFISPTWSPASSSLQCCLPPELYNVQQSTSYHVR